MTGAITFEFVSALVAAVGVVAAIWLHISAKLEQVKREQARLRLDVTREFVSNAQLEKTETRLIVAIDRLVDEVKHLGRAVATLQASGPQTAAKRRPPGA